MARNDNCEEEIRDIADVDRFAAYPFYAAALGELEFRIARYELARHHFESALTLARNDAERRFFSSRIEACSTKGREKATV